MFAAQTRWNSQLIFSLLTGLILLGFLIARSYERPAFIYPPSVFLLSP